MSAAMITAPPPGMSAAMITAPPPGMSAVRTTAPPADMSAARTTIAPPSGMSTMSPTVPSQQLCFSDDISEMSVKPCAPPAAGWSDQSLLGEEYEAHSSACGSLAVRVDSGLSCANACEVMLTHLSVPIERLGHPKFDNDHGSNASMDFPDVTRVRQFCHVTGKVNLNIRHILR